MIKNEGDTLKKVIVSSPQKEYFKLNNLQKHNIAETANIQKAILQHDKLKLMLSGFGAEVIDIKELPGHPNSVFTRDTSVLTPAGHIKLRMDLPTRQGEAQWMAEHLDSFNIPWISSINSPGTAEGGDIILAGNVVFIGQSTRTNLDGIKQLQQIFQQMDYEVRIAKVPPPYLHIGGAMSMIAPDTVLCCKDVFSDDIFTGFKKIKIPSGDFISGNVISLGENEVIAHSGNEAGIQILRQHHVKVHTLDLSEFVKGSGGPSCLILPVDR